MPSHNKSIRALVADIRDHRVRQGFTSLTFARHFKGSNKNKIAMEKEIEDSFDLWWRSWVEPALKELEARDPNSPERKAARAKK